MGFFAQMQQSLTGGDERFGFLSKVKTDEMIHGFAEKTGARHTSDADFA